MVTSTVKCSLLLCVVCAHLTFLFYYFAFIGPKAERPLVTRAPANFVPKLRRVHELYEEDDRFQEQYLSVYERDEMVTVEGITSIQEIK